MRTISLSAALCFCAVPAFSAGSGDALSRALLRDFKERITGFRSGSELYARLEQAGPEALKLRAAVCPGSAGIAYFDPEENMICLNAGPMTGFFGMKRSGESRVVPLLLRDPKARAALARRADSTFVHELVHALQYYLYPNYRRAVPKGVPLEFEYEAYMTESMYTHDKLRAAPERLKAFLRGKGRDVYTVAAMGGYLALSLDQDAYREKIRRLYEEDLGGFISLEKAEKIQKNSVADSKVLAYATGRVKDYSAGRANLKEVRAEKEAYDRSLGDFFAKRWPSFSAAALFFVGSAALEEKAYPLALECLAVADAKAAGRGVPAEEFRRLREKGAVAVLEAAAFVKDRAAFMKLEELAAHLKALETACVNTGRPFPEGLETVRAEVYPRAAKMYAEKAASEKDKGRARSCAENAAYFGRGR